MSTITRHSAEPILQQVALIVAHLQKAVKIICLYPPSNPSCAKVISLFTEELSSFLQTNEQLLLYLAEDGFTFEGESVEPTFGDSHRLSKVCYDAGVSEIAFTREFCAASATEMFDIFRRVITKDEGAPELGEELWGKHIAGFSYEIIEDQSYLEFDSELRREFFSHQEEGAQSGYLSDSETTRLSYQSAFEDTSVDDSTDSRQTDNLVSMTQQRSARFDALVATLADDAEGETSPNAVQDDDTVRPRDLLMRVYELDSAETHETAMALAKDSMFNADEELLGLIDDLLEQDKRIGDFSDTVMSCIKAHSYFIEIGSLKLATAILRKLIQRGAELRSSAPSWESKITDALCSVSSRERLSSVCNILNKDKRISAADFADYLSTFDWTAYSTLTEALGELESKEHRFALCDFLSQAKEEHVDLIASGLYDKRWYVARNTAIILSHFDCSRAHRHLIKAMQHDESRVRAEVVRGCQTHDSSFRSSILVTAIKDADPQIRRFAIETALEQTGAEAFSLFETLLGQLLAGHIPESAGPRIIHRYSQTGRALAAPKLAAIGGDWRLFGSSPSQRFRHLAIQALKDNPSAEAAIALKSLSKSWCKEIKTLAREALRLQAKNREPQS